VLLVEAGSEAVDEAYLTASERYNVAFDHDKFSNWGYKTTAQAQLAGQEIDYSRGKGLGGTTSINFCGWLVGPREDYDEWARLVDDPDFAWSNAKRCIDKVTRLHPQLPSPKFVKYIAPKAEGKGKAVTEIQC
jgi:choline dehydrogenase-like flavoprotein